MRNKGKSLLQFSGEYTVIDIETTGLDSDVDNIIEVSAIKIKDNKIVNEYNSLIKIENELDPFITDLTGITDKMLKKDGRDEKEVLNEFKEFIGKDVLLGHNINFDINFLYDRLYKLFNVELNNDFIDTYRLSLHLLPALENHKLITLIQNYQIKQDGLHRALNDCKATNEVYKCLYNEMLEKYKTVEEFYQYCKKRNHGIKANDITTENTEFDEENMLYDKFVVFTGTLDKMDRKTAMQKVVDLGGHVQDGINKTTNYLVIGKADYVRTKGNKSSKIQKAEKMILDGKDIKILSENVFYDLIQ